MPNSPLHTTRNKLIFLCSWLLWTFVHLRILMEWDFNWTIILSDTLFSNISMGAACLLIITMLRFYRPEKGKFYYMVGICTAISALCLCGVHYTLDNMFKQDTVYTTFLSRSLALRYTTAVLITGCMALISELWYNLQEQKAQEQRKATAEKMAKDAELYNLRQQLQPHFLFNSLNSISALVVTQPAKARQMIQQLADFLRGTLRKDDSQWTSLEDELQHLQLYLDIEKVRFGHRLNTSIINDANGRPAKLPPLLLQPIVENAIKFGLYDTTEAITIQIKAEMDTAYLIITVQNPFDPETSSPKQGTGFGLHSIQRRLFLLFARNDLLTTEAAENIFTTQIKIPQA